MTFSEFLLRLVTDWAFLIDFLKLVWPGLLIPVVIVYGWLAIDRLWPRRYTPMSLFALWVFVVVPIIFYGVAQLMKLAQAT